MQGSVTVVSGGGAETRIALDALLTPALREAAKDETYAWIKSLRHVAYGGETMRTRFRYRGDSLWWFTELYLHKMRQLETAVWTTLALEAARAEWAPHALRLEGVDAATRHAAEAFGRAHGLRVDARTGRPGSRAAWRGYLVGVAARLSRLRAAGAPAREGHPRIAAFVHTAFWAHTGEATDPRQERYIGPVLDALGRRLPARDLFYVGVGPRRNFRARRWWDALQAQPADGPPVQPIETLAPRDALGGALALWHERRSLAQALTAGPAIRAAGMFHGCDLWPLLAGELTAAALEQWPWSARAMDEAAAALDALQPRVAVTYAEAGGWGRALVLEARRRQIPSVGIQHGFIYRHWLNYRHEPDEMTPLADDGGCPIPTRTLLFDAYAARALEEMGQFPPARLSVTGSARLDELAVQIAACRREGAAAMRAAIGLPTTGPLALLAAKFSEIRDDLPALVAAVEALPDVRLAIKPHPAETPEVYAACLGASGRVTVLRAAVGLAPALAAADALVTMNSTVAIDGLALGLPALVVGLPNNLSPFVAAGVMLGATGADEIRPQLEAVLYDRNARARLSRAASVFADQYAMRPSGQAADRAAGEILALAGSG